MNLYLYGMGSPFVYWDPLGLFSDGFFSAAWDFCKGLGQVAADGARDWWDDVSYIGRDPMTLVTGWGHLHGEITDGLADAALATALNDAHGDIDGVTTGGLTLNLVQRMTGVNNVAEAVAGVDRASGELITDPVDRIAHGALGVSGMAGTAAGVASPVLSFSRSGTALTRTSLTTELKAAAQRASRTVGPGRGGAHGTRVHSAFKREVDALGRSNVRTEVSYLRGRPVDYGTRGSIRIDVGEFSRSGELRRVFDLKTGNAKLSNRRLLQLRMNLPGGDDIPIFTLRP